MVEPAIPLPPPGLDAPGDPGLKAPGDA